MKNKLLITSALVSMVASGAALAETKISGNMTLGYKAITNDVGGTTATSKDGFGRETQLNIAKSGALTNGLNYAAGFSLEFDGGNTSVAKSNENIYFDIISGNTTVSFGLDHAPNTSQSATPRVAEQADTTFVTNTAGTNLYQYHAGSGIKEDFAVTLIQKTSVGSFSGSYVPSQGDTGGNDEAAGLVTNIDNGNSAYNIIYTGNAGVDGLTIKAAYQKEENYASEQDGKVKQYGIGYNFGKYAAGVTINDVQGKVVGSDTKSIEWGATAALSNSLSVGVLYIKTEGDVSSAVEDEKITLAQVGYNMGPATLAFSYGVMENYQGLRESKDIDVASVRLSTNF
jgi:hypothetical protein